MNMIMLTDATSLPRRWLRYYVKYISTHFVLRPSKSNRIEST